MLFADSSLEAIAPYPFALTSSALLVDILTNNQYMNVVKLNLGCLVV